MRQAGWLVDEPALARMTPMQRRVDGYRLASLLRMDADPDAQRLAGELLAGIPSRLFLEHPADTVRGAQQPGVGIDGRGQVHHRLQHPGREQGGDPAGEVVEYRARTPPAEGEQRGDRHRPSSAAQGPGRPRSRARPGLVVWQAGNPRASNQCARKECQTCRVQRRTRTTT